jgi:hypothetical protein
MFPNFIGLTWENQKTSFSMFLTSTDPYRVQITWNFGGMSFSTEQDLGAKEMQQGSHEGQTGMAHMARFPSCVGPTHSSLVAPMPLIFVSIDLSWPKTIYKKGPPRGSRKRAPLKHRNTKQKPGRSKIGGENSVGRYRCDLHPLRWLYLCHNDEEGVVYL